MVVRAVLAAAPEPRLEKVALSHVHVGPAVQAEAAEEVSDHLSSVNLTPDERTAMNLSFSDIMLALIAIALWLMLLFGQNLAG